MSYVLCDACGPNLPKLVSLLLVNHVIWPNAGLLLEDCLSLCMGSYMAPLAINKYTDPAHFDIFQTLLARQSDVWPLQEYPCFVGHSVRQQVRLGWHILTNVTAPGPFLIYWTNTIRNVLNPKFGHVKNTLHCHSWYQALVTLTGQCNSTWDPPYILDEYGYI